MPAYRPESQETSYIEQDYQGNQNNSYIERDDQGNQNNTVFKTFIVYCGYIDYNERKKSKKESYQI